MYTKCVKPGDQADKMERMTNTHYNLGEKKYKTIIVSSKTQKAILQFAKTYRDKPQNFWNKVFYTGKTKINL